MVPVNSLAMCSALSCLFGLVKEIESKSYQIEKAILSIGVSKDEYLKDVLGSEKINCKKNKQY